MITAEGLRSAAVELRRAAADLDGREVRQQLTVAGVRDALADVEVGWVSPASGRWQGAASTVVASLGPVPVALRAAAATLRRLALEADRVARELGVCERQIAAARHELELVARLRLSTAPDDAVALQRLARREADAHDALRRATTTRHHLSGGWDDAASRAAGELEGATGAVDRAAPPAPRGPVVGGGPPPWVTVPVAGGGVPAPFAAPGEGGAAGWARWGWDGAASPVLHGYIERRRYGIFHLPGGGAIYDRPMVGHDLRVKASPHWREPRALQPGSPLEGRVRPPRPVAAAFDGRSATEVVSSGPRVQIGVTRGEAARFRLDDSLVPNHVARLGFAGGIVEAGLAGVDQYQADLARDDLSDGQRAARIASTTAFEGGGSVGGGMLGAKGGGLAGAALGTVVLPGVGTAVGAVGGAVVGGIAGSSAGKWIGAQVNGRFRGFFGGDEQ